MPAIPMTINLSVAKVESGGNTGQGKYFYSFDHNTILVTDKDTPITFQLSPETAKNISITTIITSGSGDQVSFPLRGSDPTQMSIIVSCSANALFSLAIVVDDASNAQKQTLLVCDPQVVCIPRIPPIA